MASLLYHWNFTGVTDVSINDVILDDKENLRAVLKSDGDISGSTLSRGSDGINLNNIDASNGGFYIDLEGLDSVNLGGDISIEMAVKNNDTDIKSIYFLSVGENESGLNQAVINCRYNGLNNKDRTMFSVKTDGSVGYNNRVAEDLTGTVINNGDEHHYIFSINYDSSSCLIYIDGEKKGEKIKDLEQPLSSDARSTNYIGTRKNLVDRDDSLTYLNGIVKYLKIYRNAMSGTQASTIYNNFNNAPYLSNISAATNEAKHTARHSLNFPTGVTSFNVSGNQLGLSNGNEDYKILKFVASSTYNISDNFNYVPLEGQDAFIIMNHESILYKITQTSAVNGVDAKYKLEVSLDSGSTYNTECTDKGFGSTYSYNNVTIVFGGVEFVVNNNSPICLHEDTLVKTDQGNIKIKNINSSHTIDGCEIIYTIKSPYKPSKLILIKKNALGLNIPEYDIKTTLNHTIVLNNKTVPVYLLLNNKDICLINNDNSSVYNVIMLNKQYINIGNLKSCVMNMSNSLYNQIQEACLNGESEYTLSINPNTNMLRFNNIKLDLKKYKHFKGLSKNN